MHINLTPKTLLRLSIQDLLIAIKKFGPTMVWETFVREIFAPYTLNTNAEITLRKKRLLYMEQVLASDMEKRVFLPQVRNILMNIMNATWH